MTTPRDDRVDRVAAYVLGLLLTICLGVVSYAFSSLREELRLLREDVKAAREDLSKLGTRLAVLEAASLDSRLRALEQVDAERRIQSLERRADSDRRTTDAEAKK